MWGGGEERRRGGRGGRGYVGRRGGGEEGRRDALALFCTKTCNRMKYSKIKFNIIDSMTHNHISSSISVPGPKKFSWLVPFTL